MKEQDLSNFSMLDLFRIEVGNQSKILVEGLLSLERSSQGAAQLEVLMRAAHSLKGAARIVNLDSAVRIAHAMEDCFVAAQQGSVILGQGQVDLLLGGVDLLVKISQAPASPAAATETEVGSFVRALGRFVEGSEESPAPVPRALPAALEIASASPQASAGLPETDRVLRVTAKHLNRLLGLAGESLVESRHLGPFADSLLRLKRQHAALFRMLGVLRKDFSGPDRNGLAQVRLAEIQEKVLECREFLADRLGELDLFEQRSTNLSYRLYDEALACRMRPFADGIHGLPRMVRDLGRSLGKEVKLEITGETTDVDRDLLERLEAPLVHLLRNAVDHGIEAPADRARAGKPVEGLLRLDARHNAGTLQVTVSDDGAGIDPNVLRQAVVEKKLAGAEIAAKLSEAELFEFLFLPGFTLRKVITEISGRGVGLDVVQSMIKQVRGTVRIHSEPGNGTRFQLQLPLTLSVVRTLVVEIGGEPYAFPLAHIVRTLKLPREKIELLEGRQHFRHDGRQIGLITAHQILECVAPQLRGEEFSVIVVGEGPSYGVVVDRFLGERELVVHPLDSRLGKIKDVSAAALVEDGAPALIIDVEEMVHSIGKLISGGPLTKASKLDGDAVARNKKRVLIVDDSLTVRELERKLLSSHGYEVEAATDGMDGWNAVRTGHFDLVISDVDMPRMDGIEFVTMIKKDPNLKAVPVMIVSYKDREQDRQRGLDAGADYYLTKGSFHDETLLNAVRDLIGEPVS